MSYENLPDPKQAADGSWFVQYEIKNSKGEKIGETTLTGTSEREVWKKLQIAHAEASAAIARMRTAKFEIPKDLQDSQVEALKAREARNAADAERASYAFLRRHTSDFNQCQANIGMIENYVRANDLPWTVDSLETAFAELQKQGSLVPVPRIEAAPASEVPPEPQPVQVPWSPNPLTREAIRKMDRIEFRRYTLHKDPAIRAEFTSQVDAAQRGQS